MFTSMIAGMAVAGIFVGTTTITADETQKISGEIQSVAKDHIVLKDEDETHRIFTTSATQVVLDGEKASLDDLKSGFKANVTARKRDDQMYAAIKISASSTSTFLILIAEGEEKQNQEYKGTIQKVNNTSLQVTNEKQKSMAFVVATETVIMLDGKPASLTDLKAGYPVKVTSFVKDGQRMAKSIVATSFAK